MASIAVVFDAEWPFWDQASLNNTKLNSTLNGMYVHRLDPQQLVNSTEPPDLMNVDCLYVNAL